MFTFPTYLSSSVDDPSVRNTELFPQFTGKTIYTCFSVSPSSDIMIPQQRYQTVECKTLDGIALEGWFYEVKDPAPVIIMTHGVSGLSCFVEP